MEKSTDREVRLTPTHVDLIGRDAAMLSAVEVGLGSLLHTFKVPLAGQALSLNQIFMLTRTAKKTRGRQTGRFAGAYTSCIASVLKSLAPSGKKLTPMLAISAQGMLFSLGTICFGANLVGAMFGAALSSVWAFLQPLLIYYVIFGKELVQVADYLYEKTREAFEFDQANLIKVLFAVVGVKIILAILAAAAAWFLPEQAFLKYEAIMLKAGKAKRQNRISSHDTNDFRTSAKLALKDLANPLFVVSLIVTTTFFYFSESSHSRLLWLSMRPVAVGFLIFFLIRWLPFERIYTNLIGTRFSGIADSFKRAIEVLRRI